MKISKLFHWLYFMVMMLPLFVVPIYFIYSQRHDLTMQTQVDIQYKYQSNEVTTIDDLKVGNVYELQCFNKDISDILGYNQYVIFQLLDNLDINYDELLITESNAEFESFSSGCVLQLENTSSDWFLYTFYSIDQYNDYGPTNVYGYSGTFLNNCHVVLLDFNNFNGYNLFKYTDYNVIDSVQIEDTNTSITNAFVNSFADTIDKYFNYDNALNFGDLYTWLNITFFNNQAPLGFFIFWHLLIYWLLTSLLWLLFDVLLYVPQLCHRWLDKASIS